MDTNSNIPAERKIVSVEILHLDKLGYGPQGKHTRREWRKECLDNLRSEPEIFKKWQENWLLNEGYSNELAKFGCILIFEDGSQQSVNSVISRFALDYSGHVFVGNFFASDCEFLNITSFYGATFKNNVMSENSVFHQPVIFKYCRFEKYTKFDNANFKGDADFSYAEFHGNTSFSNVKFENVAFFTNTLFSMGAAFIKTIFMSLCLFHENINTKAAGAIFEDLVSFENATFSTVGHFEGVKFKNFIPNFLGVANGSTRLEFSGDEYFAKADISEDAIKRLGMLKRLADEHGQADQAIMFNAFELNAKRAQARIKTVSLTFLQKLSNSDLWFAHATYLYDKFSDYGRSFTRPLLAYGVLMLVTFVLSLGHGLWASMDGCEREGWNVYEQLRRDQVSCPTVATVGEQKIPLTVPRAAFEYTAYRASGVLDFVDADKQTIAVANRLFNQPIEPMWMRIWGVLKAIASAALLFLAALGLRNKYRIK